MTLPHWHLHSHAMEIFRHCELGSIKFLWVIGTNPAVSLPELHQVRDVSAGPSCSWSCQDAFLTETAELADVVLPAALWGEKTGRSPMPTARSTSRTRRSSRPARPGPTWTSSSTSPAGWTSATRTASRW